jgi:hypothetical protein
MHLGTARLQIINSTQPSLKTVFLKMPDGLHGRGVAGREPNELKQLKQKLTKQNQTKTNHHIPLHTIITPTEP